MKKVVYLTTTFLALTLMTAGNIKICYADMYVEPRLGDVSLYPETSMKGRMGMAVFVLVLLLPFICRIILRLSHAESKTGEGEKILEGLCYNILILTAIPFSIMIFNSSEILCLVPFLIVLASLYFRWKKKNKGISYAIIAGYLILIVVAVA